jgi:hypothetical protein
MKCAVCASTISMNTAYDVVFYGFEGSDTVCMGCLRWGTIRKGTSLPSCMFHYEYQGVFNPRRAEHRHDGRDD